MPTYDLIIKGGAVIDPGGCPAHIIPNNHTEIIPFLHICRTGLATTPDSA